jgi:type II secretory ATPase GspE/PulE/Tfp pilus assembly ATPase PilB-like protein
VFSTLHTNSAAESIARLLDMGMDPFNFADALLGVLSQRLARSLCAACKKPHVATADEIDELAQEYCVDTPVKPENALAGRELLHRVDELGLALEAFFH